MQSMSYDAYRRDKSPEHWAEPFGGRSQANPQANPEIRPDVYEEQGEQWALLRHEVEGTQKKRWEERERTGWEARDTGDEARSSTFAVGAQTDEQQQVDIVVVGVGGGGMNAINRMISTRVRGVRFAAMNTDAQVLALSPAPVRICLGQRQTKGLGAGGNAAVGARAASESTEEIRAALSNADLVFIAAGMGGGTGTGAAPVVASIAKKLGALTVGIVTLPFSFEGSRRRRVALDGIAELSSEVDALITVPNDRLLSTVGRDRSLADAFKVADDVLRQGVQGIAEVINVPGMVNVDFADVRSVLREAGTALMSIGQGEGRNRAQRAAEEAVAGGFLNVTIRGAKRVLFNISGGEDMTLFEINEVAERIGQAIDDTADITFGAVVDPSLVDTLRVTLIAAGMDEMHTVRIQAVRPNQSQAIPPVQPLPAIPQMPQPERPRSYPTANPSIPAPGTGNVPRPIMPPNQTAQPNQPNPPNQPNQQQPYRPAGPPPRPQRSLSDLRGIRSMGRRQFPNHGDDDDDEGIDIPPFLKR